VWFAENGRCAGNTGMSTNIVDAVGDEVTVSLTGPGSLLVTLDDPGNVGRGAIQSIVLDGVGPASALSVRLRKSSGPFVEIENISVQGSLKSITASSASLSGGILNITGQVGNVMLGNILDAAVVISATGLGTNGPALNTLQVSGVMSNAQVSVTGSLGRVTAGRIVDSIIEAGYTPAIGTNLMAGGTFAPGMQIGSVSVTGTRGSTGPVFANSVLAADKIGSVTLASANTNNNGLPFGVLANSTVKSVAVAKPKFTWNTRGRIRQILGDFQVRRLAAVTIAAGTRVLGGADLSNAAGTNGVYVFPTNVAALQGVQAGDVLASSVGSGLLVKVASVSSQGGLVVVQTAPASLVDAIQEGAFDQTIALMNPKLVYAAPGVSVATNRVPAPKLKRAEAAGLTNLVRAASGPFGQLVFDYTFPEVQLATNITLNGSIDLTITPNLTAQIGLFSGLQSFSASVTAELVEDAEISIDDTLLDYTNEVQLIGEDFDPFVFFVGIVPVVVVPRFELYAGVVAKADAGMSFGGSLDASVTAGARWQNNVWTGIWSNSAKFATNLPVPSVSASVRGYVRPELVLMVYGLAGPDIYTEGGATLAANLDLSKAQFCGSLTGDLDAGVGMDLLSIGGINLSYQDQLFSYTNQFLKSCFPLLGRVGSLQVTINPPEAVNQGAAWQVDAGTWQNGGTTLKGLLEGNHTVGFKTVDGWSTPASQTVSIEPSQTNVAEATYLAIPQTGSLQVTINPPDAASQGAAWQVDGGAWQVSGTTLPGLSVGNHTLTFSSISGWIAPSSETVTIIANSTATPTGIYSPVVVQYGSLQVTILPTNAVSAGARWQVDGGAWQGSGATISGLPAGSHIVTFSTLSGWVSPPNQMASISNNQLTGLTAYYAEKGSPLLITFDDLADTSTGLNVPNGYQGLIWNNFGYLNALTNNFNPSGYSYAVISSNNVAFNWSGSPAYIRSPLLPFDLVSAYLTAAWRDGLQLQVEGYVGPYLAYSNVYTLSATAPTLIEFNYLGVDQVVFSSAGGTPQWGNGENFAMDNLTIVTNSPPTMPTLTDDFENDTALDPAIWAAWSSLLDTIAGYGEGGCSGNAFVAPMLSFGPSGMQMSGANNNYEFTGIQSLAAFSPPFTLSTTVTGTIANGNAFELFLSNSNWTQRLPIFGNINLANCGYYGIWIDEVNDGFCASHPDLFYGSAAVGVPYTFQVTVDATGFLTVSLTSNGATLATQAGQIGLGPFHVALGQGEGSPCTGQSENVAVWQFITVTPTP